MREKSKIAIMGLGNVLLGDEGFGVHFLRWFSQRHQLPPSVEIVEGGVLGCWLLDSICNCEKLIVIDVIKADDKPGAIFRFTREEMELYLPTPTSAHEVQFADVLFQAEMLEEAPAVIFICIVPKSYGEMEMRMSDIVADKFPAIEALLLKELASEGITGILNA